MIRSTIRLTSKLQTRQFTSTSPTMVNSTQRDIIKATIPLLETGGEALATRFYKLLLDDHPDLRPLFNSSHQASGRQPRALAGAILAYAKNVDNLTPLKAAIERINNKHVALQILPEHYPKVGSSLLQAIREVLGAEIATEEVLAAWAAAYGDLSSLLIGAEEKKYHELEAAPGGWRAARSFRVVEKVGESDSMTSFVLKPVDGEEVMEWKAGQYIGLKAVVNDVEHRRNYSLSSTPNGRTIRISVQRQPHGVFSNYLHDETEVGATFDVFPPVGNFVLNRERKGKPVVLISAGAGITPMLPLVKEAVKDRRPVVFVHCARSEALHPFRSHLTQLAAAHHPSLTVHSVYTSSTDHDRLSLSHLQKWLTPETRNEADFYFLGPKGFLRDVRGWLKRDLGVEEERLFWEFFGPAEELD
ncbi:hypothetical protein YB2330_006072 [Saitoella coloradoensis]